MEHCKFCQAELEEGSTLCPSCGKDNADEISEEVGTGQVAAEEEKESPAESREESKEEPKQESKEESKGEPKEESKKESREEPKRDASASKTGYLVTPGKLAVAIAVLVVLVAALVALVVSGMDKSAFVQTTQPTVPVTGDQVPAGTIPADGNPDDETCKGSYTATDEEVIANRDVVVATAGDHELTLGMLQIFYWREVGSFLNNYGAYAYYYGLDYTQPLDTQPCMFLEGRTWQQYFLASALNSWRTYLALDVEAENAGFILPDEYVTSLDEMPQKMEEEAVTYGFATSEEFLRDNVGAGATVEMYVEFMEIYYHGYSYFNHCYAELTATDEEVEAMFAEHEAEYAEQGLTKETKTVDVRHILIYPEGATSETIRTGTFPEEAWTAGEVKAQEILDLWLAGDQTAESFGLLAEEHSGDPGSAANGGLYTGVYQGDMVDAFDAWCFDPERQVGDYDIVRTEFGFHIMYYAGETIQWRDLVASDVINEKANELVDTAVEALPIVVDYSKILLSVVSFG